MPETDFVVVLTTWPADGDPSAFARILVEGRLAACVNVLGEMESTYRWEGRVEEARERQLVIKTARSRVPEVEARLRELHPYDVAEFLVLRVADGGADYLAWVAGSTAP